MSGVFSGARALFAINNQPVAYAGGVSGSESIDYEPVDVLDLLEVKEFVPVAYRATLSAQIFRVIGQSLKALNIFPAPTQADGGLSILTSGDLTCQIQDRLDNKIMAQFQNCKCSEHSFDVTARGITSENVTFVTIRMKDEFELST